MSYTVSFVSLSDTPGLHVLEADLGPVLWAETNGCTLARYESDIANTGTFSIDIRVEAEDEVEARERAYECLEATLKGASTWRQETGVVFDDEVGDDDERQSYEIGQLFDVSGVSQDE